MGALTLKSFPFILRSWNVKNYDSIDPTDSFGQETKVYLNKNKIVKIEPQFVNNVNNPWLTDKGRQFFDSLFTNNSKDLSSKTTKQWKNLFVNVQKNIYIFDICNFKNVNKFYCLIVFENLNLENLSLLSLVSQAHPYIKIKRAENLNMKTDLELNFQVNSATSTPKLGSSSLCLLIGSNTRYEGSYLNLKLRQRYFKGNFKLLSIGSLCDLTFPVSFLGSNMSSLKIIVEGNHVACKDLVNAVNPQIITNSAILKNKGVDELLNYFHILKHANVLSKVWSGYNVLNSSLYETGIHNVGQFSSLSLKDLLSFSSFYVINVNLNNVANFKKILESRVLNFKSSNTLIKNKLVIVQNLDVLPSDLKNFNSFLYFPTNGFFGEKETFVNTEGLIKRTSKITSGRHIKSDWQLLRKFVQTVSSTGKYSFSKANAPISFLDNSLFDFRNFIGFQLYACKTLTNLNFYLCDTNQKFNILKKFSRFGISSVKLNNKKLKYWLDDFYIGGKDSFCLNSVTLVKCSLGYKLQSTNFF